MNTQRARFSALATAAFLVICTTSACGSDNDSSKVAAPPQTVVPVVSKADFVTKGNELCRANSEAVGSKFRSMSNPPKPAEMTAAFENLAKESYKFHGDLLSIGAPAGQEKQLVELLVQMQQVMRSVEKQGQAAFFADDSDPFAPAVDTLVNDFGLSDCAHED